MAVKETWQGTEVKCLCWHTALAPQVSFHCLSGSIIRLSMSKTLTFLIILPVFFIHIGHLGICVKKQPDFFPQDQFHANNPCQTWHKQGWNPNPGKVNSNTPMGVRVQIILSAFCTLLMPACLWGCLLKEIFLPRGGERAGRQINQGQRGENLKCDVRAFKDGLSFSLKGVS